MTNRQKAMGIPDWAVDMARNGEWLRCSEAMLAQLATVKRGTLTTGRQLIAMWLPTEYANTPWMIEIKREDAIPMWLGISAKYPDKFHYTCTHDMDSMSIY